ncbi:MAG: succinylglutamate desuccinylase/aspartoacylase family protein [Rhodospirillaceae bacterium]
MVIPDLSGIDSVTGFDSGVAGPHLLINALSHGNEPCGAVAIERLIRSGLRPRRGRLTLVLANVAAFARYDPHRPLASRFIDEDFNRLWSAAVLDGPGDSVELRRARYLLPLYQQADALLDLHSMATPGDPLILCGWPGRARALACSLGFPRWVVADPGHAAGRRLIESGDFARSDAEVGPEGKLALLVECGQHGVAETAETAFNVSLRFLRCFDVINDDLFPISEMSGPVRQIMVEVTEVVTVIGDSFIHESERRNMEIIAEAGTIIGFDQGRSIRTPYDNCVLILPARKVGRGQTAVRFGRIVVE